MRHAHGPFKGFSENLAYFFVQHAACQTCAWVASLCIEYTQHMYRESYEYLVSLVLHLDIAGNTLTVSNLVGPLFGTDRSSLNGLLTTFFAARQPACFVLLSRYARGAKQ